MDGETLQDRLSRGLGRAARKLGASYAVYRPDDSRSPLAPANRVIRLAAWFEPEGDGATLWHGIFDAAYTQVGDYLVGAQGTLFVTRQGSALPIRCVLTNSVVSVGRAAAPAVGGYGGLYGGAVETVVSDWPASLHQMGSRAGDVQTHESRFAAWSLLLPVLPAAPRVGDTVRDDRGQTYAVGGAEKSAMGWRLTLRQVGA